MTDSDARRGILAALLAKDTGPENEHYEAFGRFVAAYALAEASVHRLARHLSGMTDQKARHVFDGFRLKDSIDRLNAFIQIDTFPLGLLLPAKLSAENAGFIRKCLDQIQIIGEKRGSLVHRVVSYENGAFKVSNVFTAKSFLVDDDMVVTKKDLQSMQLDCGAIFMCLMHIVTPNILSPDTPWKPPETWLYKPPPPASPASNKGKSAKGRQPQTTSSHPKLSAAQRRKMALGKAKRGTRTP